MSLQGQRADSRSDKLGQEKYTSCCRNTLLRKVRGAHRSTGLAVPVQRKRSRLGRPGSQARRELLLLPFLYQFSPGESFKQPFQPRHPLSEIGYIPSDMGHILSDMVNSLF